MQKDMSITKRHVHYLGVVLDDKLLWNEQVELIRTKALKSLGALSSSRPLPGVVTF